MRASKSVRVQRTTYEVAIYLPGCRQFCTACTIVSNFDHSEFNVEAGQGGATALLATLTCGTTLQSTRNIVLYHPLGPQALRKLPGLPSLKLHYQEQHLQGQLPFVDYLATARLPPEQHLQMMRDYGLRASEKSMELKGRGGEVRVIIGKRASKRYCVVAGPLLTPIQLFALAIVNVETS